MPQPLTILGRTPVRTRPFTSRPVFGEPEEKRLLRAGIGQKVYVVAYVHSPLLQLLRGHSSHHTTPELPGKV